MKLITDIDIRGPKQGISYQELILEILYLGASRFGLLHPAGCVPVAVDVREAVQLPFNL